MRIERVSIERLVMEGIELENPAAFGRSVEGELRRLLGEQNWNSRDAGGAVGNVDAGSIDWQPGGGAESLARAVAGRISGAIMRGAGAR